MNAVSNLSSVKPNRIHPLVAAAAVSVIVLCGTGVAAMTGLLPSSKAVASAVTPATPVISLASPSTIAAAPSASSLQTNEPATHAYHRPATHGYVPGKASLSQARDAFPATPAIDPTLGEVTSVNAVQTSQPTTGLGAIGGAVAGGLAGTQVGNGRGKTVATIVGALGGGLAGNAIEHAVHKTTTWQVQVRMADGSSRSFTYQAAPEVQIGEHVRVNGEALTPA